VLHNVFIGTHAGLGVVAFIAGIIAMPRGKLINVFLWTVVGTIAFLVAALGVEWDTLDTTEQVLFAALTVLGIYMVIRAVQAVKVRPARTGGPTPAYIDHVGFNLIALFDAFVVIVVLDLGGPIWLMAAVAFVVALVGHFAVRAMKYRLAAQIP
jgi:hypothetical protein